MRFCFLLFSDHVKIVDDDEDLVNDGAFAAGQHPDSQIEDYIRKSVSQNYGKRIASLFCFRSYRRAPHFDFRELWIAD